MNSLGFGKGLFERLTNFLNDKLIQEIKQYIPLALKEVQHLIVAFQDNKPLGFIGINDRKIEMLFVDSNLIGKGVGTCLINFVFDKYNVNEVVVNEQNPNAHNFYLRKGFIDVKRSELDEQGNPYPIIFMNTNNMNNEVTLKTIDFAKDQEELIDLTKQSVKFNRFVEEKDIEDYATLFFLNAYKEASICLGAYISNLLKGFILFSSFQDEKMHHKYFPNQLYEKLSEKFSSYKYLENTEVYRETCEKLLNDLNEKFDGEISLFVVDKKERGRGLGRLLLTKWLDEIEREKHKNIFLTSDNECNYSYYKKYGFNIVKEDQVKYSKEVVTVFIETKRF